ncbi:MAG: porin family protein [Candidatus Aminicenantes bacterium]|nr:porin family protein [Candidatus Aminicenantes bacterium]
MKSIKLMSVVLSVMFILSVNLPAQGGVKGGFNLSKFYSVEPAGMDQKYLAGFQVGLFKGFNISPSVQIQPEIFYIQKGSKVTMMIDTVEAIAKIRISYFEIPLLFKFNLKPDTAVNPYLIAGPYVAFRSKATLTVEAMGQSEKEDIKEDVKSTDFGIIGGGGVEFKMGDMLKCILVEIRYELGLVNIDKGASSKAKNSSIVFNVGVGI